MPTPGFLFHAPQVGEVAGTIRKFPNPDIISANPTAKM
jgi:hypothetical protein